MEYLIIKGYGIIFFVLISTDVHMDVLAPHNGGKRHDDGPAGFEPLSLVFGFYSNPLRLRRFVSAVENMRYISGVFKVN